MIKIGNTNISEVHIGSTEISAVYVGSNLVYQKATALSTIEYTSTNHQIVNPWSGSALYGYMIDNTYDTELDKGTISFSTVITDIYEGFYYCATLKSITIPDSVTSIGASAFCYCTSLTDITIPNSVTSIDGNAFQNCYSLTSITIPNSVTSIGMGAFQNCTSLTGIVIPNSVTSIGQYVFSSSGLVTATIPTTSRGMFSVCGYLQTVTLSGNSYVETEDVFVACNSLTTFNGTYTGISTDGRYFTDINGTTILGFAPYGLSTYTFPEGLTTIGQSSMRFTVDITDLYFPSTITTIGYAAFNGNTDLDSVHFKSSTHPTLRSSAFDTTSFLIYVPSGSVNSYKSSWSAYENRIFAEPVPNNQIWYTTSNNQIFTPYPSCNYGGATVVSNTYTDGKGVITFDIPPTQIGDYFKSGTDNNAENVTSITLPNNITSIGDSAFGTTMTSLQSINLDSVQTIGDYAFDNCTSLTSLGTFSAMRTLGIGAFQRCSALTNIPTEEAQYLNRLGTQAFAYCTGLTEVVIATLNEIGDYLFNGCTNITKMTFLGKEPATMTGYQRDLFPGSYPIYVPEGKASVYKTASGWIQYADRIFEEGGVIIPTSWPEATKKLWYQTTDGQPIEPDISIPYWSGITSHTYTDGMGKITSSSSTVIANTSGNDIFANMPTLKSIYFYQAPTTMPTSIFSGSENIENIFFKRCGKYNTFNTNSPFFKDLTNLKEIYFSPSTSSLTNTSLYFRNGFLRLNTKLKYLVLDNTVNNTHIVYLGSTGDAPDGYLFANSSTTPPEGFKIYVPGNQIDAYRNSQSWEHYNGLDGGTDYFAVIPGTEVE